MCKSKRFPYFLAFLFSMQSFSPVTRKKRDPVPPGACVTLAQHGAWSGNNTAVEAMREMSRRKQTMQQIISEQASLDRSERLDERVRRAQAQAEVQEKARLQAKARAQVKVKAQVRAKAQEQARQRRTPVSQCIPCIT